MKKVSTAQMIIIMICCLFSRFVTYAPEQNDSAMLLIISEVVSFALLCVLVIPMILLYNKSGGQSILTIAYAKNKATGIILSLIMLVFCMFMLFYGTSTFTYSLQYCFSQTYSSWSIIIVFSLAGLYIASMGIPSLARTATVIAAVSLIIILIVMMGYKGRVNPLVLNLARHNKGSAILIGVRNNISRAGEFVILLMLLHCLKSKPAKTIYIYLVSRLAIATLIFASIAAILGNFALTTKLPFFSLSSYSRTEIIERFDTFFLMIWVLSGLIRLAATFLCIIECVNHLLPKVKNHYISLSAVTISNIITITLFLKSDWKLYHFDNWKFIPIIVLTTGIPLFLLFVKTRYTKPKAGETA